jgi:hypothetical protein
MTNDWSYAVRHMPLAADHARLDNDTSANARIGTP